MSTPPDQTQTPYASAVAGYADQDWLRLDVPGHQAWSGRESLLTTYFGRRLLELDLPPLVDGIDYGDRPTPLGQSARLAASAWGARKTYFLTNGGSKGNLVSCIALRSIGEQVLVQRSVHSSVIDGIALAGLDASFVIPVVDSELGIAHGVSADRLRNALRANPGVAAVYIVTPSYFGAVADVRALAEIAHDAGAALVVDEAWGAHFGFHPDLPSRALHLGADIVVSSTHKMAGSLTQSAMLHLGEGPLADRLEPLLDRAFRAMQSTSASALLMASLDIARQQLVTGGSKAISESLSAAAHLRSGVTTGGRFRDASARLARRRASLLWTPYAS